MVSSFIRIALPRPSLFVETTPAGHFFWLGGWQSLRFLTFEDCWYCYNFHNNERHYHWYHHVQTPSKELEIWQKRGRGVSTCQAQRRKTPPCRPGLASKEKSQKTKLESHWQKLDNNASLSDVGYFWASQNVLIKFRYLCSYVGLLILHESLISWFKSCKKNTKLYIMKFKIKQWDFLSSFCMMWTYLSLKWITLHFDKKNQYLLSYFWQFLKIRSLLSIWRNLIHKNQDEPTIKRRRNKL